MKIIKRTIVAIVWITYCILVLTGVSSLLYWIVTGKSFIEKGLSIVEWIELKLLKRNADIDIDFEAEDYL